MATIHLPSDFKEFLKLLSVHQVEYLLIGGYAVGYHGYPRATADMDIWVAMNPSNSHKIVIVLKEFVFDLPELSPELFLKDMANNPHGRTTYQDRNRDNGFRCQFQ